MPNEKWGYSFGEETYSRLTAAESGYTAAIQYYNLLKQKFLQDIMSYQGEISDNMAKTFLNDINDYLKSQENEMISENDEKIKQVYSYVETVVANFVERADSFQTSVLESIETAGDSKRIKKDTIRNYAKRARQDLDILIQTDQSLRNDLNNILLQTFGVSTANTAGINSLFKRALINQITHGKYTSQIATSLSGYKNLFRGYYSELMKTEAADAILKRLAGGYRAQQAGDTIGEAGLGIYDIIIGKSTFIDNNSEFQKIVQNLNKINNTFNFDTSISITTEDLDEITKHGYGVQSKLWLLPDELKEQGKQLKDQWYEIGMRSSLASYAAINVGGQYDYSWNRGWHQGVLLLSKELIQVFGQAQVLFGTRNAFIWTADMINQMHQAGLYVSYYFSRDGEKFRYPGTSQVVWDAPRYNYMNQRRHAAALRNAKNAKS